jgi:hypothetical protein
MSSSYSNSLRVELIGSGDQAGTWGTTTDNNFAYIFDTAIAGINTVTVSSVSQALTYINGPTSTAALNQSIYAILKFDGAAAASAIYAPPVSKQYIIWNNSSFTITIYNSTVIGNTTAAGTGVAILAGSKVMVWSDGTNFYDVQLAGILPGANGGTGVANTGKTITLGGNLTTSGAFATTLTATGTTAVTLPTTGTLATLAGSETLTNKTLTSPTLTTPVLGTPSSGTLTSCTGLPLNTGVTGTLPVANGGTGTSSPSIVAGSNISVSGSWPNQTIASTGSTGVTSVSGTGYTNGFSLSGTVTSSGNLTLGGALISLGTYGFVSVADNTGMYNGAACGFYFGEPGYSQSMSPPNPATYTLGRSGQTWSTIYLQSAPVVSSDVRNKIVLGPTPGLDFISRLETAQYKLKIGGYDVEGIPDTMPPEFNKTPIPGHRIHYGLLAQQVKSVVDELQLPDFGGWLCSTPADPESEQSLRYEEFIAPMIKAIQDLKALVDAQAARITALEAKVG